MLVCCYLCLRVVFYVCVLMTCVMCCQRIYIYIYLCVFVLADGKLLFCEISRTVVSTHIAARAILGPGTPSPKWAPPDRGASHRANPPGSKRPRASPSGGPSKTSHSRDEAARSEATLLGGSTRKKLWFLQHRTLRTSSRTCFR